MRGAGASACLGRAAAAMFVGATISAAGGCIFLVDEVGGAGGGGTGGAGGSGGACVGAVTPIPVAFNSPGSTEVQFLDASSDGCEDWAVLVVDGDSHRVLLGRNEGARSSNEVSGLWTGVFVGGLPSQVGGHQPGVWLYPRLEGGGDWWLGRCPLHGDASSECDETPTDYPLPEVETWPAIATASGGVFARTANAMLMLTQTAENRIVAVGGTKWAAEAAAPFVVGSDSGEVLWNHRYGSTEAGEAVYLCELSTWNTHPDACSTQDDRPPEVISDFPILGAARANGVTWALRNAGGALQLLAGSRGVPTSVVSNFGDAAPTSLAAVGDKVVVAAGNQVYVCCADTDGGTPACTALQPANNPVVQVLPLAATDQGKTLRFLTIEVSSPSELRLVGVTLWTLGEAN